jgi:MinD superfamily P-loop ATPase
MIQVAVVSGKGGTGKTVLTASCGCLLPGEKVLIDADVDAANLALLLDPHSLSTEAFRGMDVAVINPDICTGCGKCAQACVFDAVIRVGDVCTIVPYRCEGCVTCTLVCPEGAIHMKSRITGMIHYGTTRAGPLIYGSLIPGSGNSGLLVHRLRQEAGKRHPDSPLTIIDGPPGIGCPLISTITGIQIAVIVTEPSKSAQHDLLRLITLCRSFKIRMFLVVNRFDISSQITDELMVTAEEMNISVIGKIPYDPEVVAATRKGIPVIETKGKASEAMHKVITRLTEEIKMF